jgi:hypothetical protein
MKRYFDKLTEYSNKTIEELQIIAKEHQEGIKKLSNTDKRALTQTVIAKIQENATKKEDSSISEGSEQSVESSNESTEQQQNDQNVN